MPQQAVLFADGFASTATPAGATTLRLLFRGAGRSSQDLLNGTTSLLESAFLFLDAGHGLFADLFIGKLVVDPGCESFHTNLVNRLLGNSSESLNLFP